MQEMVGQKYRYDGYSVNLFADFLEYHVSVLIILGSVDAIPPIIDRKSLRLNSRLIP